MRACGAWSWWHPEKGPLRWFCGSASCSRPECANLFWSRRVRLITDLIAEYGLSRFFTLTLDPDMVVGDPWTYVHAPWSKFRKRMNRRHRGFRFVAVLETHKDRDCPHIHGFTNVWMHQRDWSAMWQACCGGAIVWVEQVKSAEVSEYVSKQIEVARYVGKEQLSGGYKHRRNAHTLWRSTNTRSRFELTKGHGWRIVKENVYQDDGQLTDYWSMKGVWNYGKDKQQGQDVEATRRSLPQVRSQDRFAHMEAEESKGEHGQGEEPASATSKAQR